VLVCPGEPVYIFLPLTMGAVDRVAVMVTPVVPHPTARVEHYFTLIVGSRRYY
jgi:hypothetical protein